MSATLADAFSYQTVVGYAERVRHPDPPFRSSIEVQIESPGTTRTPGNDNRILRLTLEDLPGAGREPTRVAFDLWVEDFDRLIAAMQAAVAEARRAGVLPPLQPEGSP